MGTRVGSNGVFWRIGASGEQLVHLGGSVGLGLLVDVLVEVLGKPDIGVADNLRNDLRRHALSAE